MRAFLLAATLLSWDTDLTHLANELPKLHPNPWHHTTRAAFEGELARLGRRAPHMQKHEVVVELARIVTTIGDGHTRLTLPLDPQYGFFLGHAKTDPPKDPELGFHAIGERFAIEDDGLFTTDGRRVKRIGSMSAADALAAVMPVAHGDNEWQKREVAAGYLAIPEVLHARGVIAKLGDVPLELEGEGRPVPRAETKPWSYRVDGRAVIFQYDEVTNTKEETLAQFGARMFETIDTPPIDKLIIDLRNNRGGNNHLNRSLLHGIIRSKKLTEPGSLFVLVGRRTFSAAMMFALDLERHTKAIFIGEPTGGRPNSYGDSRKLVLPESGLTVRISTLYWQNDPRDKRETLEPHVRTRDPLAVALDYYGGARSAAQGNWSGTVTIGHERLPFTYSEGKFSLNYPVTLRAGTKRLAGTMFANGMEYLVTAEKK